MHLHLRELSLPLLSVRTLGHPIRRSTAARYAPPLDTSRTAPPTGRSPATEEGEQSTTVWGAVVGLKKLLGTRASLLGARALLVVTRS